MYFTILRVNFKFVEDLEPRNTYNVWCEIGKDIEDWHIMNDFEKLRKGNCSNLINEGGDKQVLRNILYNFRSLQEVAKQIYRACYKHTYPKYNLSVSD